MKNEYELQAKKFMEKTGTKFKAKYIDHDFYFTDDKQSRDIYRTTLKRNGLQYSFKFGQSIINSNYGNIPPTPYNVFSCVQKYDVGTFENFCSEFGYDEDSRKAEKIYFAVKKEFQNIERLFSDVMEELQEIQ